MRTAPCRRRVLVRGTAWRWCPGRCEETAAGWACATCGDVRSVVPEHEIEDDETEETPAPTACDACGARLDLAELAHGRCESCQVRGVDCLGRRLERTGT